VISWIQIAAYMVSSISLLGVEQVHSIFLTAIYFTQERISKSLSLSQKDFRRPSRAFTSVSLLVMIGLFSWGISILSSLSFNSISPSIHVNVDGGYTPASRFDIVISMHKESPSSVKQMLESIQKIRFLSMISPNVTIYTKNSSSDLESLKLETGAATVERLDNLGRKGATYLHHIVNKWDSLAEQTIFIQAHAHNMRELIPRIDSYLVPETGMLSLGFTGVTCDCETCGDRWGWTDTFSLTPALYTKIYKKPCDSKTPILLSYNGQFVASARRIRGVDRNIYKVLLDAITSQTGWIHDPNLIGDVTSTPDNPFFGFTLERIWGLLLQCGTDGVVAAKCHSLLSGMSYGGAVADCQCLDRKHETV